MDDKMVSRRKSTKSKSGKFKQDKSKQDKFKHDNIKQEKTKYDRSKQKKVKYDKSKQSQEKRKPKPERKKMTPEVVSVLVTKLCALRSVYDAHVDLDDKGEIYVIGIFTDGSRTIKRILREAEGTFLQLAGYKVDFKKISIVERKQEVPEEPQQRIKLHSVSMEQMENGSLESKITLEFEGVPIEESMQAFPAEMDSLYLTARVTANAISHVIFKPVHIECVKEFSMESVDVIAVTLSVVDRLFESKEMYVGSVIKTEDSAMDAAKAVLDAVNRRVNRHY